MAAINDTVVQDTFNTFVSNTNAVKNRLGLGDNSGATAKVGSIALFDQLLTVPLTIAAGQSALGVSTIIQSGNSVTVQSGGALVIL